MASRRILDAYVEYVHQPTESNQIQTYAYIDTKIND